MLKRFTLWLMWKTGIVGAPITMSHIEAAIREVAAAERLHGAESPEFRRHVAYKALTESGVPKRAAAMAIEIAVGVARST